ncbi:MAG: 2-oxo acid dehydrogenase subunit E2 [Candidatus Thermoplasmatota archaeon]|nr:2-oxo acid dehydrogenase subunit E2 [Candidatus Thermoplasmatota archaeon]
MDKIGKYEIKHFTKNRQNIVLILKEGKRRHNVHGLIDVDVTNGRNIIRDYKIKHNINISFTGWLIKCISQAVSEHKIINTSRQGRRNTISFDDVDIPIPVERTINDDQITMAYIIRKANTKSVLEITKEVRDIQKEKIDFKNHILGENLTSFEKIILSSPLFVKKIAIYLARKNALFRKKHIGTVGVTAIGMKGKFPGWAIPLSGATASTIVVGGINKKPGVVNNKIEIREYLHLTITVDHDIVDGGPLARFVDRLIELIENNYGLEKNIINNL